MCVCVCVHTHTHSLPRAVAGEKGDLLRLLLRHDLDGVGEFQLILWLQGSGPPSLFVNWGICPEGGGEVESVSDRRRVIALFMTEFSTYKVVDSTLSFCLR